MSSNCDLSFQQKNLFQQGFQTYTASELNQIKWGLRFTPAACTLITIYGLYIQSPLLLVVVAFLGMWAFFFPAGHPMDLLYNHLIRRFFNATKLPPNPFQRRLACLSAGLMNSIAAIFFVNEMPIAALITGGILVVLQIIVITTHFCTLSWMYEGLMRLLGFWSVPIDVDMAKEKLKNGALLIDVRGPDEFSKEHLNCATNLPLEEIDKHAEKLSQREVLIYCRSGARSQIATKKLNKLGLDKVFDLGGLTRAKQIVG